MNCYKTLPDNLESLYKEEKKIRKESIKEIIIKSPFKEHFKEHLNIFYNSLNLTFELTISYKNPSEDEQTIQFIGGRLFNDAAAAFKLMLAGYYQISFSIQRDIFETGCLLDYFTSHPDKIKHWKQCSNKERQEFYRPVKIREALDKRDGFTQSERKEKYKILCEYASHPSYNAIKLLPPYGQLDKKIGPAFDEKLLRLCIEELTMLASCFTLIYSRLFKKIPHEFQKMRDDFSISLKAWSNKYLPERHQWIKKLIDMHLIKLFKNNQY